MPIVLSVFLLLPAVIAGAPSRETDRPARDVVLENARFRLTLGADAAAKSFVITETGEEMLDGKSSVPFFSVTQERPYNNEIKLVEPNVRTVYPADSLRREGDDLIVGFRTAPYEAVVSVHVTDDYISFTLKGFRVDFEDYRLSPQSTRTLAMTAPPATEFRLAHLVLRRRENFGHWLNTVWDAKGAVALLGTSPAAVVSSAEKDGAVTLTADALKSVRLKGTSVAIVADAGGEALLDRIDAFERDFGLPRGVANRRKALANASIYWTSDLSPSNVAEHISFAKRGGFRLMLCYYTCFYARTGDYPFNENYPRGLADVKSVLSKVRAAGIEPGLHVLHTYVSTNSALVAGGNADRRIGLKRHFTLSRALGASDTEVFVDEDPSESETDPRVRRLFFAGELMTYEGFSSAPPWRFTGVRRGFADTRPRAHPCGEIGGLVDVSEFGGKDFYLSQKSDLQDIVADRFADLWKQGMGFVYFDGSEGVQEPFAYHVPNAQYRVWKKLSPEPFLGEGAAKVAFGWHMLSGANAFDVFPPEEFNSAIDRYPAKAAERMWQDFSRVNFGWWMIWNPGDRLPDGRITVGAQPDMWEYGTSRAAGWDAPVTVQMRLWKLNAHPRKDDLLEVIRRWEDVRARKWLTPGQKEALKSETQEHHLYLNGKGEYELVEMEMLPTPAKAPSARAFIFARDGKRVIAYWHTSGAARLAVDLGKPVEVALDRLRYLETPLSFADARAAWAAAVEKK